MLSYVLGGRRLWLLKGKEEHEASEEDSGV